MKTTTRKGLGSESGQVLPITVLFMGVIIGAAAISIDVAKVSALRNQAQTATSAAALAAAQQMVSQINGEVQGTSKGSISTTEPTAAAQEIYKSNIATAIGHSSTLNNCQVSYYIGSTPQPSGSFTLPSLAVPVYVRVTAEGNTPMNFGAALGISSASVKPEATAEIVPQSEISTNSMLPLVLPATAGDVTKLPLSSTTINTWSTYWQTGSEYAVYRGNGTSSPPSWTSVVSRNNIISYHKNGVGGGSGIFGDGSFGWISGLSTTLATGSNVSVVPGAAGWRTRLAHVAAGQLYVVPIANPVTINGENSTSTILGYATITIDVVNKNVSNGGDLNLGFVFTLDSDTALPGDTISTTTLPKFPVNYSVQLVSNSSMP